MTPGDVNGYLQAVRGRWLPLVTGPHDPNAIRIHPDYAADVLGLLAAVEAVLAMESCPCGDCEHRYVLAAALTEETPNG